MARPYSERQFPPRDQAAMPPDQVKPWLLILPAVLISPFPTRKNGPTDAEASAISVMQRRLGESPVGVWISADGTMTPQTIATDVLVRKTRDLASVRLPPPK